MTQTQYFQECLNNFKILITKEFPAEYYEINYEPIISVSFRSTGKAKERVPRISFTLSENFMTDIDSNLDKIFS